MNKCKVRGKAASALFICPDCGGSTQQYDNVSRIVRTKGRKTAYIKIKRYRCTKCGAVHRQLSDDILPFKQYEAELISGVVEGIITSDTLGFEDYPCETTMKRWIEEYS